MTNQTQEKKKFTVRKLVLWGTGLSLLICSVAILLFWNLPFDPKSPPATELGTEPDFDSLLENGNRNWLFLFNTGNQIIETDIYGDNERVMLDIVRVTQNSNSELLSDFSISPNGKLLAANYFNERDSSDQWNQPIGKIVVVDIKTGRIVDVPILLGGYEFDWTTPVYWLSSEDFLVKMHRYLGNDSSSEDVVFLLYDLQDIASPQKIEIDHCGVTAVTKDDSNILLLTSNCIPFSEIIVWAIDIHGKRKATSEEIMFYDRCESEWWLSELCHQKLLTQSSIRTKVERVVGDYTVEGFGRWYDNNWDRHYIYLNDKIVRVSDGWIEEEPVWDADLNLLTWDEVDKTFQMDNQGHYRFWYDGKYIGKIPRSP